MAAGNAVIGGQAYTDLLSRFLVFPSYGYEKGPKHPGTVLCYCFHQDAVYFSGMKPEERVETVLSDL